MSRYTNGDKVSESKTMVLSETITIGEQKAGTLLPCRCGALPKIRTRKVDYFSLAHSKTHTKYFVECPVCFYTDGNLYGTKAEAVEAWNRRAEK